MEQRTFPTWRKCGRKKNAVVQRFCAGTVQRRCSAFEALQKKNDFNDNKVIQMRKLGCTLFNLANICSHSYTSAKFYPFIDIDEDLLSKFRQDMVGGPSNVYT